MRGTVVGGWFQRKPSGQEQVVAFVVQWLITAAAVWVAAELLGGIHLEGWKTTLIVALILGALNAFLKPLLVLGALPAVLITMGLFLVLINTALLALTAWICGKFDSLRFAIDGFWDAVFGAVIIAVVSFVLSRVVDPKKIARGIARR